MKARGCSGRQRGRHPVGDLGGPGARGAAAAPRLSWPGVIISQLMCAVSIWADRHWGFDFWWSTTMVAAATGYAVAHLHPPYGRPLLRLAALYALWLAGGFAGRGCEKWLSLAMRHLR